MPVELRPLVKQRREELTLDGIRLADLGATEVDGREEIDLAVFYALQLTPERLEAVDVDLMTALGLLGVKNSCTSSWAGIKSTSSAPRRSGVSCSA